MADVPTEASVSSGQGPQSTTLPPKKNLPAGHLNLGARSHAVESYLKSYLTSPAYLDYRTHYRLHADSNGELFWSDELEEAFGRALRSLPLLSSSEELRGAYPHQRCLSIAGSIYTETGKRVTARDISDHIVALDISLSGNSDWEVLVRGKHLTHDYPVSALAPKEARYISPQGTRRMPAHEPDNSPTQLLLPLYLPIEQSWPCSIHCDRLAFVKFIMWSMERDSLSSVVTRSQGRIKSPYSSYPYFTSFETRMFGTRFISEFHNLVLLESSLELSDKYSQRKTKLGAFLELDFNTR
ncbi:hypothetical protein BDV59DRAFT_55978 [Aspergillus ambiguus]|uniref:uncharacterized protein n=1 Tax=Aspergillus ambiguus TaxID=176160 RepID=UPI003CCCC188